MKITDAVLSDFNKVFEFVLAFLKETGKGPVNKDDLSAWILQQMSGNKSKVLLAKTPVQTVALFMGAIAPHLYNRQRSYAFDWVLYVIPEYRHTSGKPICKIYEVFEKWARAELVDEVFLALISPARSRLERFMVTHHGYKVQGTMLRKGF